MKLVRGLPTNMGEHAIEFNQGYASLASTGRALWEQVPEEPLDEFKLFTTYRNLDPLQGRRNLIRLSKQTGAELKDLVLLKSKWYWELRCQAYDQFVEDDRQYCIVQRQQEIMHRHATTGRDLFNLAYNRLQDTAELMTPKVALEVMKLAIELERSIGGSVGTANRAPGMYTQVNINGNPHSASSGVEVIQSDGPPIVGDKERIAQILNVLKQTEVIVDVKPEQLNSGPAGESGNTTNTES